MKLTKGNNVNDTLGIYIKVEINGILACHIYSNNQIDFNSKEFVGFSVDEMKSFTNIMENFYLFYNNINGIGIENTEDYSPYLSDDIYLPEQYKTIVAKEPYFQGNGNHYITQLETICGQYKEYTHQQAVIKRNCKSKIVELLLKKSENK